VQSLLFKKKEKEGSLPKKLGNIYFQKLFLELKKAGNLRLVMKDTLYDTELVLLELEEMGAQITLEQFKNFSKYRVSLFGEIAMVIEMVPRKYIKIFSAPILKKLENDECNQYYYLYFSFQEMFFLNSKVTILKNYNKNHQLMEVNRYDGTILRTGEEYDEHQIVVGKYYNLNGQGMKEKNFKYDDSFDKEYKMAYALTKGNKL